MKKLLLSLIVGSSLNSAFAQIGDTPYTLSEKNSTTAKNKSNNLKSASTQSYSTILIYNDTNKTLSINVPDVDHLSCWYGDYYHWFDEKVQHKTPPQWGSCADGETGTYGPYRPSQIAPREIKVFSVRVSGGSIFNPDPSLAVNIGKEPAFSISNSTEPYGSQPFYHSGPQAQIWKSALGNDYFLRTGLLSSYSYDVELRDTRDYGDWSGTYIGITIKNGGENRWKRDTLSVPDNSLCSIATSTCPSFMTMTKNSMIVSDNGLYAAFMQNDGNFVLYNPNKVHTWDTNTKGKGADRLILQTDGNLVLYSADGKPVWASNTANSGATKLVLQDDGNLVLYNVQGNAVWATGTVWK